MNEDSKADNDEFSAADAESLGACAGTNCTCQEFVYENGTRRCGRAGCGHLDTIHKR